MSTWALCMKPRDGPYRLCTRALSGHNGTAAAGSELLFLWWLCYYWLTQRVPLEIIKAHVVGVNCSLTKKKNNSVYSLAKFWGKEYVGNFSKTHEKCTHSKLPFRTYLALKLEYFPTLVKHVLRSSLAVWTTKKGLFFCHSQCTFFNIKLNFTVCSDLLGDSGYMT